MRAAALLILAVIALSGCGGSGRGGTMQSGSSAQASGWLAFSACMRSNGVRSYPDPVGSGPPPKRSPVQLGVAVSRFRSAQSACTHLLPNGGAGPTPAQVQHVKALSLRFARCVRAHGVPTFPDPGSDGRIPDAGFDQGSPKFQAANDACRAYRPPYMPSNAEYDAWARTHQGGS